MRAHYNHLKSLAIFAAVVESGSFSSAAKKLHMSRSSVSEQVAKLESDLAVRLLQRTTRKLALTEKGEQILPYAKTLIDVIDNVNIVANKDAPAGIIRITTTHDFAIHWLLPRLEGFQKKYPDITFNFITSDEKLDLIEDNIDLALRIGKLKDDNFIARPLFEDKATVVASKNYIKNYGRPDSIEELNEHKWILLEQLNPKNQVILYRGTERFVVSPKRFDITRSPIIMRNKILSGSAIGVHLNSIIADELANNTVENLFPEWRSSSETCYILYPSRRHIAKRNRLLIDFLLGTT